MNWTQEEKDLVKPKLDKLKEMFAPLKALSSNTLSISWYIPDEKWATTPMYEPTSKYDSYFMCISVRVDTRHITVEVSGTDFEWLLEQRQGSVEKLAHSYIKKCVERLDKYATQEEKKTLNEAVKHLETFTKEKK